jgi:hypothetical protein
VESEEGQKRHINPNISQMPKQNMILPGCIKGLALSQGMPVFISMVPSGISSETKQKEEIDT